MEEGELLYNSYFWLSLAGLVVGCLHFSLRSCERSNCYRLICCDHVIMERTVRETPSPLSREASDSFPL